tara:strand:+ start:11746 stop:11976 length:231 start_codon:yes stop_codon:yes gene_type:complete
LPWGRSFDNFTWFDLTWLDFARFDFARLDFTRLDFTWLDFARLDFARCGASFGCGLDGVVVRTLSYEIKEDACESD